MPKILDSQFSPDGRRRLATQLIDPLKDRIRTLQLVVGEREEAIDQVFVVTATLAVDRRELERRRRRVDRQQAVDQARLAGARIARNGAFDPGFSAEGRIDPRRPVTAPREFTGRRNKSGHPIGQPGPIGGRVRRLYHRVLILAELLGGVRAGCKLPDRPGYVGNLKKSLIGSGGR